ncbi:TlpA family protein disulfide reductase [Polaribacter huanghezhanensis]|uniref:TlpA family protein disulfide reductase n=1 Tax=Polaribacter huanghezhanensis TaxID=1354726 RepID=UPI002648703C|nr:TlpA disulfide reductase family protein [Polaribacter huanghezhanensis]
MNSKEVKVRLTSFGEKFSDKYKTVNLENGEFILDTLINEPKEVIIQPNEMLKKLSNGELFPIPSKLVKFFIYPKDRVNVSGSMSEYKVDYKVDGNLLNNQYSDYRKSILNNYELGSKLFYDVENLYSKGAKDSIIRITENNEIEVSKKNRKAPINYINKNQNIELSSFLLANEQKEVIIENYDNLSEKVKKSDFGIILKKRIDNWKNLSINSTAPNFEYQTYKSGKIKLSENNGKFIVLDFWGSWCGPCIMEMPKMKEFYKNNSKKIEIIGIAARDKEANWIKAIKENNLTWKHIFNNKKKDDLVKKYGVTGFPTKIIINPNGKIEGIYLGIKEDFYLKMEELLKN